MPTTNEIFFVLSVLNGGRVERFVVNILNQLSKDHLEKVLVLYADESVVCQVVGKQIYRCF